MAMLERIQLHKSYILPCGNLKHMYRDAMPHSPQHRCMVVVGLLLAVFVKYSVVVPDN